MIRATATRWNFRTVGARGLDRKFPPAIAVNLAHYRGRNDAPPPSTFSVYHLDVRGHRDRPGYAQGDRDAPQIFPPGLRGHGVRARPSRQACALGDRDARREFLWPCRISVEGEDLLRAYGNPRTVA